VRKYPGQPKDLTRRVGLLPCHLSARAVKKTAPAGALSLDIAEKNIFFRCKINRSGALSATRPFCTLLSLPSTDPVFSGRSHPRVHPMKTKLIVLSLAANLALAGVYAFQSNPWFASLLPTDHGAHSTDHPAAVASASISKPPDDIDPQFWQTLSAGDLPSIVARLKAAGYPLSLQRAILTALIAEKFADKHKAVAALIAAHPWWRGNLYASPLGAKVVAARQQVQREENELLEQLLGPDAGVSAYALAQRARKAGDLSPSKASELNRITSDYDELINQIRNAAQNILLPEDREQIAFLEQEKRTDLKKLLTPEELLEYDLRSSPTANQLRTQLTAFKPTEEEYRAIFELQNALDAQYGTADTMSAEQRRQRFSKATQDAMTASLKTVLTPDRFADFQQKTDPAYIQANNLATRLALPETTAADVVAVQKDVMKRAEAIRSDKGLSSDQRAMQLNALGGEAVARLTPTLGAEGVTAYKQTGGNWINNLQRPPAAKKP
jgi:hypothetical protein